MTNATLNAIANRNRHGRWTALLAGAAIAITYLTSALYLPL